MRLDNRLPPRHVTSATIAPLATERVFLLIHLNLHYSDMTIEEINSLRSAPPVPEGISDSERAQLVAYDAYEARFDSWDEVERLVSEALELDEQCIDAYVAEWLMFEPDCDAALDAALSAEAVATREIERRWPDGPDEDLWGDFVNRPIVRGIAAASLSLWAAGEFEDAVMHAERVLALNPDDNLGMRWHLPFWRVIMGDAQVARKLTRHYPLDAVAPFTFARALTEFAAKGPRRKARTFLAEAQESNPMLFRILRSPAESLVVTPDWDCYAHGSWQEALQWHALVREAWQAVPGALEWTDALRDEKDFVRRSKEGLLSLMAGLALDPTIPSREIIESAFGRGVFPADDE